MPVPILKLDKDDPQKELEFEVRCALLMTQGDRIKKQLLLTERVMRTAKKYEVRRPYQIIKRETR